VDGGGGEWSSPAGDLELSWLPGPLLFLSDGCSTPSSMLVLSGLIMTAVLMLGWGGLFLACSGMMMGWGGMVMGWGRGPTIKRKWQGAPPGWHTSKHVRAAMESCWPC
jgi:hypothetical protein